MPCKLEGKIITPCPLLEQVTNGQGQDSKKGVIEWVFSNIRTLKVTQNIFGVRSGLHKYPGVAFNYCPFCGTQIYKEDSTDES